MLAFRYPAPSGQLWPDHFCVFNFLAPQSSCLCFNKPHLKQHLQSGQIIQIHMQQILIIY